MKKFLFILFITFSYFNASAIVDLSEYDRLAQEYLACNNELNSLNKSEENIDQIKKLEGQLLKINSQIKQIENVLRKQNEIKTNNSNLNEFDIKNKNKIEILIKHKVLTNSTVFNSLKEDKKFKELLNEYLQVAENYLIQDEHDVDFLYKLYSTIFNIKKFKLDLNKEQKDLASLIDDMLKILDRIAEQLGYSQFKSDQGLFNFDSILQQVIKKIVEQDGGQFPAKVIENLLSNEKVQQALASAVENIDPSLGRKIFKVMLKNVWWSFLSIFGVGK